VPFTKFNKAIKQEMWDEAAKQAVGRM